MLSHRDGALLNNFSTSGNLTLPASGTSIVVYEPGAYINGTQGVSNTATVQKGHGFDVGDDFINFDAASNESTLREVLTVAAAGTSFTFNGATLAFTDGDRLINLGDGETGVAGAVLFDGSGQRIWSDPDGESTISASTLTPDSNTGRYNYWFSGEVWELILTTGPTADSLAIITDGKLRRVGISAAYTITPSDGLVAITSTGAAYNITLPAPADVEVGSWSVTIKDEGGDATAFTLTIVTPGAETIDGAATLPLDADHEGVTIYTDGTNFFTSNIFIR